MATDVETGSTPLQITELSTEMEELLRRVQELEARIQASTDLTDDLISQANTVITAVGDRASESIEQSALVLSGLDLKIGVYLAVGAISAAFISALISLYFSRSKAVMFKKVTDDFNQMLVSNDEFRHEFLSQLTEHPNLRENLQEAIDNAARDLAENTVSTQAAAESIN